MSWLMLFVCLFVCLSVSAPVYRHSSAASDSVEEIDMLTDIVASRDR